MRKFILVIWNAYRHKREIAILFIFELKQNLGKLNRLKSFYSISKVNKQRLISKQLNTLKFVLVSIREVNKKKTRLYLNKQKKSKKLSVFILDSSHIKVIKF